jgi:Zn-finger nucleic acid-binding protein
VPNCTNCSAPLPINSIRCEYCGSRNDVDLKEIHFYTTHETDAERICPRCRISLKTVDLKIGGKFFIERCEECFGLFFDPGELEALLNASVTNVFEINRTRLDNLSRTGNAAGQPVKYLQCPVCSKIMNRINFGTRSGVVVDRCKEHGIWLDGGEFRQLCEWMKAGGELLDREKKDQLKKEEALLEMKRRQSLQQSGAIGSYETFDDYGSSLRVQDPDLFSIVSSAIRFFTRL